jgi:hypothetical protein
MPRLNNAEEKESAKARKNHALERKKRDASTAVDRVGPRGYGVWTRARLRKAFCFFQKGVSSDQAIGALVLN